MTRQIHLFNGGVGRLMIPLYFISKDVLQKPSLYLSDFFERNRSNYIDGLMQTRTANDLGHRVRFFLAGTPSVPTTTERVNNFETAGLAI